MWPSTRCSASGVVWLIGLPGPGSGEKDVRRAQRQRGSVSLRPEAGGDQGAVVCDLGRVMVDGGGWRKWMEDTTSQDSEASFVVRAQEDQTQPAARRQPWW